MRRLALFLLMVGCGNSDGAVDSGAGPDSSQPLTITLEARQADGSFAPVTSGDDAELLVGIQGLRFVELRLVASGGSAVLVDSVLTYTVEGQEPFTQTNLMIELVADGAVRRSQEIRLIFAGSIDTMDLRGRMVHVAGRWTASGGGETTMTELDLVLRDDDTCIHRPPPDPPLCSDAGI